MRLKVEFLALFVILGLLVLIELFHTLESFFARLALPNDLAKLTVNLRL